MRFDLSSLLQLLFVLVAVVLPLVFRKQQQEYERRQHRRPPVEPADDDEFFEDEDEFEEGDRAVRTATTPARIRPENPAKAEVIKALEQHFFGVPVDDPRRPEPAPRPRPEPAPQVREAPRPSPAPSARDHAASSAHSHRASVDHTHRASAERTHRVRPEASHRPAPRTPATKATTGSGSEAARPRIVPKRSSRAAAILGGQRAVSPLARAIVAQMVLNPAPGLTPPGEEEVGRLP